MRDNNEKILHIGADLDADLVSKFRFQTKTRDFKIKVVLRRFLEWWLDLDATLQQGFYHNAPEVRDMLAAAEDEAAAARDIAKQQHKRQKHRQSSKSA